MPADAAGDPAFQALAAAIVQATDAGVFAFDPQGRVTLWNPTLATLTGIAPAAALGRSPLDLMPAWRTNGEDAGIQAALAGRATTVPAMPLPHAAGVFEARYAPLPGPGGTSLGGWCSVRDVTAARRAQEQLEESEARFRTMADTAPVMLWMAGTDGECSFFNQPWLDFSGRTLAQEQGVAWAEGVHAEDFQACMNTYLDAFVARRPFRVEYRLRRKDGAYRWILDTGIPRWTPGGAFAGFVGSCIDITELKEAHDAIVRGRAARAEADALRHADELKDHFLAIVSHELRTPINAIMGFASVLDDEVAGAISPRHHDLLGKVLRGADGLLALVDDLLDMSRIKAGKFHLEPARIAFKTVIEEVLAELAALAAPRGVQLAAEVAAELPPIVGDERRLGQVLRNLAGNAIKFSPDGALVTVRACPRDGRLRVEVADRGPGIAADDLARLFRPFVQVDQGPRRSQGGTGLGLSIARAIVEAHGGTIGADSQVGVGTTFWFELPT